MDVEIGRFCYEDGGRGTTNQGMLWPPELRMALALQPAQTLVLQPEGTKFYQLKISPTSSREEHSLPIP